jgi:small subunit ribosomal protein S3Ae
MAKALKGKEWFKVFSPKFFGEKLIGETPAMEPEKVIGRIIDISLTDLTSDPSRYYIKLFFKINKLDGNRGQTVFIGHECTRDFISRVVQLRTRRIDTNEVFTLQDTKIRIKTLAVTNAHVTASVSQEIRRMINQTIKDELVELDTEKFIMAFTSGQIQQVIRDKIKKIYPIRAFEFNKTHIL